MKTEISLNKSIFWDVSFKNLDYQKDADFIIERVLNYGDEGDYRKIRKVYSLQKIKYVAQKANYIDKKNVNFRSIMFDIPINLFKCTKKLSIQKQSAFLKR